MAAERKATMSAAARSLRQPQRVRPRKSAGREPLTLLLPPRPEPRRLPRVQPIDRKGPFLRPSPIVETEAWEDEVLGLNLMAGCPHQCSFCYARAYPTHRGDDVVLYYQNVAQQLRLELNERRKPPRAVYLCPSTDPFPPFREVQEAACDVLDVLAEYGVEAWFMTRGFIRPFAMERILAQAKLVRITMALATLDRDLSRVLEPLAAPPKLRIRQLAELRQQRIAVQASVEPLMPGVTDTRDNLEPLVNALADADVEQITTSYFFLRRGIRENMLRELGPVGWAEPLLDSYADGPVLEMGNLAPAKHLPRAQRQKGYALLMALAADRGINTSICRLTNPDFQPLRSATASQRQMVLPYSSGS